ncbi:DsrE family protein [Thioalkalivibrio sp. ALMg11]|uniref:DsrE family protein n=1 Tax=Thioalkalivibrio sp. ALMg11 TaxID=1158165 RepID=UPI00036EC73F|nr:DsrE family protein [Thioalkalivibrio sp. ALMg11]
MKIDRLAHRCLKLVSVGLLAALLMWPASQALAFDDRNIAWHVGFDNPSQYSSMLGSINSMVEAYEGRLIDYDIVLVFRSAGIRFVTDDNLEGTPFEVDPDREFAEQRDELRARLLSFVNMYNVRLELCDNTRQAVGLPLEEFYEPVELVDSGIVQLGDLHHEGYAVMHAYRN